MALCSNGLKPTIEWQHPGEDKQRIVGADNYTIQANETKNISWIINNNNCDVIPSNYQVIGCVIGGTHLSGSGNYIYAEQNRFFENNTICLSTSYYGTHQNQQYYRAIVNGVTDYVGWLLDVQVKAIIVESCEFKVFKNGIIVHQETREFCPIVTHFCGEQCPPGTCQCDCGTEVCCYDTVTGKAVKSFRK